jgi:hypothetical protein
LTVISVRERQFATEHKVDISRSFPCASFIRIACIFLDGSLDFWYIRYPIIADGRYIMRILGISVRASLAILAPMVAAATQASAEPISRSNWIPNVGQLNVEGEQPLGDMWTFRCPRGGTVSVSVDTKDDTDTAEADIDPVLLLVDGAGNLLAFADDDVACSYPPVCGFSCPSVSAIACGGDGRHSVIVRDFGAAVGNAACQEGGGYALTVEVFASGGNQLPERAVDLGGGPRRQVPRWAVDLGKAPVGPALDDEDVPQGLEFIESDRNRSGASPDALTKK